ncbi:MAG: hypothetical protein ABIG63_13710 [Chloroflexota bacterium]
MPKPDITLTTQIASAAAIKAAAATARTVAAETPSESHALV